MVTKRRFIDIETYLASHEPTQENIQYIQQHASTESYQRTMRRIVERISRKFELKHPIHLTVVQNTNNSLCIIISTLNNKTTNITQELVRELMHIGLIYCVHEIICNGTVLTPHPKTM